MHADLQRAAPAAAEQSKVRGEIKGLIKELRTKSPYIESNIFKSVENVHINAIMGYKTPDGARHSFLDDYDNK